MPFTTLIVDDEPLAREGLRLLLSQDPEIAAVREARNGREAAAAIRNSRPDLVFLDVQMPEMDGFGVVREVGAERMPPVVFVTAHDRFESPHGSGIVLEYIDGESLEERVKKQVRSPIGAP